MAQCPDCGLVFREDAFEKVSSLWSRPYAEHKQAIVVDSSTKRHPRFEGETYCDRIKAVREARPVPRQK